MAQDTQRTDTDFLRFVATVLIVNSHLDAYYPWPMLATGGMLGNSLFFLLSAFGVAASWRNHPRPFSQWYGRRIQRILPSVWAYYVLFVLPLAFVQDKFVFDRRLDFLSHFLFPPDLWFVRALLIYYIVVFVIISREAERETRLCLFALATGAAYGVAYWGHIDLTTFAVEQPPFKILFYLLVVLWGVELARRNDRLRYAGPRDLAGLALCLAIIYSHKGLIIHGIGLRLQCLQQLLVFPLLYYSLKTARSPFLTERVMGRPLVGPAIHYISTLTLEIYCVHGLIKEYVILLGLPFPGNLAVLLAGTILLAVLVKYLGSFISAYVLTEDVGHAQAEGDPVTQDAPAPSERAADQGAV
jgi:hypothetical protein